jgi:8-oxo-dGTP pyrophosphatase MutT (NUDIX family)
MTALPWSKSARGAMLHVTVRLFTVAPFRAPRSFTSVAANRRSVAIPVHPWHGVFVASFRLCRLPSADVLGGSRPMPDDLAPVLQLLRAHATLPLDPHEAEMTAEVIRFTQAHPDCLHRTCAPGHLTGSAWIVSPDRKQVLLTHHHKLERWLQLGGHADGDGDLLAVALREAREESGLTRLRVASTEVFDVDRHWIPPRKTAPGHYHHDLRFLIEADPDEPLVISNESKDLAWIALADVARLNPEESMARMVRKTAPH